MDKKEKMTQQGQVASKAARTHMPLLHISKRPPVTRGKAWMIRTIAILVSMVFMGVVSIFLTKENPFVIFATLSSSPTFFVGLPFPPHIDKEFHGHVAFFFRFIATLSL